MSGKAQRIKRSTSHFASAVKSGWEEGLGDELSMPVSRDPLLPARYHLFRVLQPFQTVPPNEDKVFKHTSLWEIFHTPMSVSPNATECP